MKPCQKGDVLILTSTICVFASSFEGRSTAVRPQGYVCESHGAAYCCGRVKGEHLEQFLSLVMHVWNREACQTVQVLLLYCHLVAVSLHLANDHGYISASSYIGVMQQASGSRASACNVQGVSYAVLRLSGHHIMQCTALAARKKGRQAPGT
eukprot:366431-Chlamydomonas_euryale.AAC.6